MFFIIHLQAVISYTVESRYLEVHGTVQKGAPMHHNMAILFDSVIYQIFFFLNCPHFFLIMIFYYKKKGFSTKNKQLIEPIKFTKMIFHKKTVFIECQYVDIFDYSSVEERDQWMKALSGAIEENTQRRNTFETVKAGNQVIYSYHVNLQIKALNNCYSFMRCYLTNESLK